MILFALHFQLWCLSALQQIAGIETGPLANELKSEIMNLVLGTLSLPINFPGTNYHRGIQVTWFSASSPDLITWLLVFHANGLFMQARRKIVSILEKLIKERVASPCSLNYMLDSLLRNDDDAKQKLNDEQIIDLVITVVYSGFETVSTTSMMAVKYLSEHPRALEELRVRNMLCF